MYGHVKVRARLIQGTVSSAEGKLAVRALFSADLPRFGRKPLGVLQNIAEMFVRQLAILEYSP